MPVELIASLTCKEVQSNDRKFHRRHNSFTETNNLQDQTLRSHAIFSSNDYHPVHKTAVNLISMNNRHVRDGWGYCLISYEEQHPHCSPRSTDDSFPLARAVEFNLCKYFFFKNTLADSVKYYLIFVEVFATVMVTILRKGTIPLLLVMLYFIIVMPLMAGFSSPPGLDCIGIYSTANQ